MARALNTLRERLIAADPGHIRLRLALSAVLGISLAVVALLPFGMPLTVVILGAVSAMLGSFAVHDPEPRDQAMTLIVCALAGTVALTAAALGTTAPPTDSVVFVLLIFVAVYAQRFGSRGTALGSVTFFLFFFAMFLQATPAQLPRLLLALAVGLLANALVRFVLLPRRPDRELLRVRIAVRARTGGFLRAVAAELEGGPGGAVRKHMDRMHECVLLIEDLAEDVAGERAAHSLRRRAVEIELATHGLAVAVRAAAAADLPQGERAELVTAIRRLRTLVERDPRELPLISVTSDYSRMLVEGSRLDDANPGDEVRRAIAELAVADERAQRIAGADMSAEPDLPEEPEERTKLFAYDNRTRNAIQAVLAGGLAVVGGELVSPQRWYWAVLTVFVVFVGTSTGGATFVKGVRRVGGTFIGLIGGVLAALLAGGNAPVTVALLLLCVFGTVYTAQVSQVLMAFFITSMLGLLYSMLGTFTIDVMWIRLAETAVGAAAGIIAALVVLPVRTREVLLDDVSSALADLRSFTERTVELLDGRSNVNVIALSREVDRAVATVTATVEPMTHRANINSTRRDYAWYVVSSLETIATRARQLAARAQPGLLAGSVSGEQAGARLLADIDLVLAAVQAPSAPGRHEDSPSVQRSAPSVSARHSAQQRAILSALRELDVAVLALGSAFGRPVRV